MQTMRKVLCVVCGWCAYTMPATEASLKRKDEVWNIWQTYRTYSGLSS